MDGIRLGGVTLFLGQIPQRKSWAFYFSEGPALYPVAYVRPEMLEQAKELWARMLRGIPQRQGE